MPGYNQPDEMRADAEMIDPAALTVRESKMTVPTDLQKNNAPVRAAAHYGLTLSVLLSRTVLLVSSYFVIARLFASLKIPAPYDAARPWWPLALLLVNALVLVFLLLALKREGLSPAALIGFDRSGWRKDIASALWMIPVSMILAVGATLGFGTGFYGLKTPTGLMSLSSLPAWAMAVTLTLHPLVNAFVEEMTYNGYVFPRLEQLTRSPWLTIVLVTFFFALQHIAIPFAFDARFLVWRFLSFVPLLLFWVLIYARMRRLTALIVVHWFMDIFAVLSILFIPSA